MKTFLLLLALVTAALAKDVNIGWTANDPAPAKYTLSWGKSSTTKTNHLDSTGLTATLTNLPPGTYYVSLTAVDASGLESDPSEELVFTIQKAPGKMRIILTLQATPKLGEPWADITNLVSYVDKPTGQAFYRGRVDLQN